MGETTDELNPNLNGHIAPPKENEHQQNEDIGTLRHQIENTREEMSETIDALQARLDPQRVKSQVQETVHEATVGRAQKIAGAAKAKLETAREKVSSAALPVIERLERTGTPQVADAQYSTGGVLKPIEQQVVVVFGASSGIGRETAIQFARRGATVVVAARSEEGLKTLVESIHRAGGIASYQVADVTDLEQVQAVAQKAVSEYGRLDTWVHCAAISLYALVENTTGEEFKRVHEVNVVGVLHGAQAALPHLKKEGRGAFIAISSVEGHRAFPYQSAYASSKLAVIGLLDALRLELQHEGHSDIIVTNVMPAGINTPFFNKARTKLGVKPKPAPPVYQPSVVADAILFAAENPTRDIFAGGAAKMFAAFQRLSPAVTDAMVLRMGFEGQKTGEPKSEDAPDNFYEPVKGYDHVGGDFMTQAKDKSLGTWLETHPKTQRALKGAAIGLALLCLLKRRR